MLKSKLFWKVLANFGLLLLILTAMTVVTLSLLSQIQKNFTIANADARALEALGKITGLVYNVPMASYRYALAGGQPEQQAVGVKQDHWFSSNFLTSCTKSVAS